jgi:serine phosphatase RsbU (regulator of sigma subunit)
MDGLPASVARRLQALIFSERAIAYLAIDAEQTLICAGGSLENYGLAALRPGEPAAEQAFFLEGLLPVMETPYFIPSVELAGGRAADIHFDLDADILWVVLLDVTAERDAARRVQQKAYEMTLLRETEARLNRELEAAHTALAQAHARLQSELDEAALYVRSLLPPPLSDPFAVDWRFVPSSELGGDAFGYHWLDPGHFAIYLLDVCGHGVGPSLLSVAVLRVLQAASLREVDFRDPAQVLGALNEVYQMQSTKDLYFTLWYGVYQPASRRLHFGSAGHPSALLVDPCAGDAVLLKAKGLPLGMMPGVTYACETITVPPDCRLYLMSDGAFEVEQPDGAMLAFDDFVRFMTDPTIDDDSGLDRLYRHLVALRGCDTLDDDFSIVRFAF